MTRPKRLWVIDPSVHEAEDQCVEQIFRGWTGERRVFRPALSPGEGPGPGDGYDADGVVVLGSSASVYDRLGWLEDLAAWLRPLIDGGRVLPVLGICFGHQLVAHLAGARIGHLRADRSKDLALRETRIEGGRLLPGRHVLRVVVSHRETVETLPEGYRITAHRPGVPLDGLEHRDLPVFTFQFHPEARDQFAARRGLDPAAIDDRLIGDTDRLLDAFRHRILSSS